MKHIYAITEKNIDGCGDSATEFISSDVMLDQTKQEILKKHLCRIKQESAKYDNCFDTADMIFDAMGAFQTEIGIKLNMTDDPINGRISF